LPPIFNLPDLCPNGEIEGRCPHILWCNPIGKTAISPAMMVVMWMMVVMRIMVVMRMMAGRGDLQLNVNFKQRWGLAFSTKFLLC
jgi:hypothetical protein